MNNDISSLEKLKEIEQELEGLRYKKVENPLEPPQINRSPFNKNEIILENINKTCMELSKEITNISNNLQELLNIFRSAIGEEVPVETIEKTDDLGSKLNVLVNQNNKLLEKLDSMTQEMQTSKYDNFMPQQGTKGELI